MSEAAQTITEGQRELDRAVRAPFQDKKLIALSEGTSTLGPAAKSVDQAKLRVAIERHVEGRKQKMGTYVSAGAVLTPDGKLRALVLFTSENWCQPQGCDLVVFEQGAFGWKSVGTIGRVRAPVLVGSDATAGWYDLWVSTGREAKGKDTKSFVQPARLQYGANGYPSTTTFAIASTSAGVTPPPPGQAVFQAAVLQTPEGARLATGGQGTPDEVKKKVKLPATMPVLPAAK